MKRRVLPTGSAALDHGGNQTDGIEVPAFSNPSAERPVHRRSATSMRQSASVNALRGSARRVAHRSEPDFTEKHEPPEPYQEQRQAGGSRRLRGKIPPLQRPITRHAARVRRKCFSLTASRRAPEISWTRKTNAAAAPRRAAKVPHLRVAQYGPHPAVVSPAPR